MTRISGGAGWSPEYQARIDQEIGDGDGTVDEQEQAVADAAARVYQATGLDLRPRLEANIPASYSNFDAQGPFVVVRRDGRTPEQLYFSTFHEAGHVAFEDVYGANGRGPAIEQRATAFAGAMFKTADLPVEWGLSHLDKTHPDPVHGDPADSKAAFLDGYEHPEKYLSGGQPSAPAPPAPVAAAPASPAPVDAPPALTHSGSGLQPL